MPPAQDNPGGHELEGKRQTIRREREGKSVTRRRTMVVM
jgi:hypothetical protein